MTPNNFTRLTSVATWLSAALLMQPAEAAPEGARWGKDYFPNYEVISHNGEKYKFYDDLIENKMVVINFIYTNCPDICPLSTARLAEVQRRLGDRVGRDIFFYSITLDPHNDTPQRLKAYAEAFGVKKGWLFLTGVPQQVATIRYKIGERSRSLSEHRADLVLGNDKNGDWSRNSVMAPPKMLVSAIRYMDPNWRAQKSLSARKRAKDLMRARYRLSGQRGLGIFHKLCAACHTIGEGIRVGPDLKGVTQRRTRDWLVRFMMMPDRMMAEKDPIAVSLDKKFNTAIMPNLLLTKNDASDLIAYIELRTSKLDKKRSAEAVKN